MRGGEEEEGEEGGEAREVRGAGQRDSYEGRKVMLGR